MRAVSGSVHIRLRPIRIAFLVHPTDTRALEQAIQINTFLWGGTYNPIIPTFQHRPKTWQEGPGKQPTSTEITRGYLDAFDPDFVVPLGECADGDIDVGRRQIVPASDLLAGADQDGTPGYGVGLFEIVRHFAEQQLKFVRRRPLDICFPQFGKRHRAFLSAAFGCLPASLEEAFKEHYDRALEVKRQPCNLTAYADCIRPGRLFLRRLASLYLTARPPGPSRMCNCVFILDATRNLDVIDYWNLRACGWNVLPLPTQALETDSAKDLAAEFVEESYIPSRSNPDYFYTATILKSRSVTEDEVQHFLESDKRLEAKVSLRTWYPRIWSAFGRRHDGVGACHLESASCHRDVSADNGRIEFRTLDPQFAARFGGHGGPRFANDIALGFAGAEEPLAEIMPEGDEKLAAAIGLLGFREWRLSRGGLVYLSRHKNWTVGLAVPEAEQVFSAWLASRGWRTALSPAGRIAKQMVKQLGGTWRIRTLANRELVRLLGDMEGGKALHKRAFWRRLGQVVQQFRFPRSESQVLERLIAVRMFQIGLEIQCPVCRQRSWHSLGESDYELLCPHCLERFAVPAHSPKDLRWAYKSTGPFSQNNRGSGAYCVLLVLRFFAELLRGATCPMVSFNASKEGNSIEADLGLFFRGASYDAAPCELVFAECKSYNSFTKCDRERMRRLADEFPGATLVFAALKDRLTAREKRLLRPLVNRGRRYWQEERPFNPVLILTGTELFAEEEPPRCWGEESRYLRPVEELLRLCDLTQQRYLDMKPWHDWLIERRKRRRRGREQEGRAGPEQQRGSELTHPVDPLWKQLEGSN